MHKTVGKVRCSLILLFFFTVAPYSLFPVHAAENVPEDTGRTVRVGYYKGDDSFQDGFSDEESKSGYAYEYYQKIATLTGWRYEYVYGSREEAIDKLLAGEVDIVAGVYRTEKREKQVLFSEYDMGLKGEKRYFAVNKERSDLLEELCNAQERLLDSSPEFTTTLLQKYYGNNDQQQALTEGEQAWLAEMGSLRVGYVRDNLPLSGQGEDGAPTGIAGEVFSRIALFIKIPLEPVCYDNVSLMREGLRNGEIDAAFPIYSNLWITETKGFFQTDSFISEKAMIVYQGSYRSDLMDKVALSETGVGQRFYLSANYPESETVFYETIEDAFKAVQKGEVNCMIDCSSIMQRFMAQHSEYQELNIAYLDTSEEFGFGVSQGKSQLVAILNKALRQLDDATITSAMVQYSNVEPDFVLMDFIRRYAVAVIAILCGFFAVLLWVFINYRRKTKHFNEEQEKARVALEAALGAANAASAAKTTFLSNMSHDIRTPMNGIIGMTAIASAHMDDPVRVKSCLEKIMASSKHLLALINEVLDMSKIESGKVQLNEEVFDLSELMDDLIILNKPLADAKHHEMVVHILNVSHEQVIGDGLRLQQIFTNLVSNAIKYTQEGGKIEITLSERPSGNPKKGYFEFQVKDNGVGMSEDYLPHLFEAFTRAEDTAMSQVQGTGLGMAIARNIARMMDGDITVESTLGKGSKFTVTLYLQLLDTESIPYEDFVGRKVLVIDNDQVICESACLLLAELGMEGEWVLSGKEALKRVEVMQEKGESLFAVLTDWKMDDMDGVSVTRELRKHMDSSVPIIVFSAYDWSVIESEAMKAGANGFIGKPLFKSRLAHLFNQLLGHETEKDASGLKDLTAQTDFSGKRALLAEDNEINAEIAVEVLSMTGLSIEWAHDGREAVNKMEAAAPGYYDCIFMDIQMPVMNGIDATRAIRSLAHPDARKIPIFAMTANAFTEDVQEVLSAGMNEHIAKPLDFEVLLKVLNDYLGS